MYISGLTLTNFRNYEYREFEFDCNTTVITGDNGVGKTNIVEAIVFLSSLRSHRTNQDTDMIMFDSPYAVLMGEFVSSNGTEKLNILINEDNSKKIKYNNQDVKRVADVVGKLNTVIFSPDTLEIIKEGPDKRRKFLDVAISKIDRRYFSALQMYKKVIRQKNKHLKHFEGDDKFLVLDTYDQLLAQNGGYIEYKRRFFIDKLNELLCDIHSRLTGTKSDVYVEFESQVETSDRSLDEIINDYAEMLADARFKEIEKRSSVKGAHTDDIAFYVNRKNAKKYCSQGQQRILLLSVLFAQTQIALSETGESPVVLLDDVLSELDNKRKQLVLDYISDYQTFITTASNDDPLLNMINDYTLIDLSNEDII